MTTARCGRRSSGATAHVRDGEVPAPDVLLIDGGLGQIGEVHGVLAQLGFADLTLVGVAKGPDRRAGQERLYRLRRCRRRVIPEAHRPASRLIQRIRDEAHRFAITGHRRRRARRYNESVLEAVPGLGPAKRRALLKHFGGLQGVMRAGVADLDAGERHRRRRWRAASTSICIRAPETQHR